LDLDRFIGNDNGYFKVPGKDFSLSARIYPLGTHPSGRLDIMTADLRDRTALGHLRQEIDLGVYIENRNGNLTWTGPISD
jgi:hypothetical protein